MSKIVKLNCPIACKVQQQGIRFWLDPLPYLRHATRIEWLREENLR